ncbi:DUF6520 family protein [Sinomicrobium sp. M5D2P17]
MKTKRIILSVSIFTIATLGAFAFSVQTNLYYRTVETNPNTCTSISVNCDNVMNFQCRVAAPEGVRFVWLNTSCSIPVWHSTDEIL